MRASSVFSFLCGAATLAQGLILTISVPETIKAGEPFNATIFNNIEQGTGPQLTMAIGFDFYDPASQPVGYSQLGHFVGALDITNIRPAVFNLTLPPLPSPMVEGYNNGTLRIGILSTFGVTTYMEVVSWSANVTLGAATSTTLVPAEIVGVLQ
ncbi:uncharacterized protein TRIVIDRAFT_111593 [Trichoderma virens Gv29-8]|uniref:Uncharacterized protein n=1 Tax=Hypocrea virens (strain Gv29-8 / FGSC 10586) TaxID=413071 RepID=G9N5F5_HYPVG|nr:uncharacterized protein TRIVIDRAFT_111593 [Trichoderma virens Gv29-8]EHK18000.1 hypothetical protein TRIVIDRAFT_111593 [Trichoderma virens Gv29-8]UKZ54139.1 hypothetical protein TrVGV298_007945 [Trichoderma virens]UKZ79922.1 hypothetical protein TrVFT333_007685 [Trichoderma virens FT-333]